MTSEDSGRTGRQWALFTYVATGAAIVSGICWGVYESNPVANAEFGNWLPIFQILTAIGVINLVVFVIWLFWGFNSPKR